MNIFLLLVIVCSLALIPLCGIEAIIFDFGGVVIQDVESGTKALAEKLGVQEKTILSVAFIHLKALETGLISEKQAWERIEKDLGITLGKTFYQEMDDWYIANRPLNEKTVAIIEELHTLGYKTPLLSDTSPSHARINRSLKRYQFFDPVILSYEEGRMKDDPKAFTNALQKIGVAAKNCIFVDDREDNIAVARGVGIDTILFTTAENLLQELQKRGISL